MKKVLKIIGWVLFIPIILIIAFAVLFYLPPFQNWAVQRVANIASEKTGMEITVNHVNLSFPLDLSVEGVRVLKQNDSLPQVKDTIADIQKTIVDLQLLPLFCSKVEVDELLLQSFNLNTSNLIASAHVKGSANTLRVQSHGIDLGMEDVMLNSVLLDGANLDIQLSDTASTDTTTSENRWKIRLQQLEVKNSNVNLTMPDDTLQIGVGIRKAVVNNGFFSLYDELYSVADADLTFNKITYDNKFEPHIKGFDYNHLDITGLHIGLDSLSYNSPDLYLQIKTGHFREQSGLVLNQISGTLRMDSASLYIPNVKIATPYSQADFAMTMNMNVLDDVNPGNMSVKGHAELGKPDMLLFMTEVPDKFKSALPHYPLKADIDISGNMRHMNVNRFNVDLPTMFRFTANGYINNIADTDHLLANLNVNAETYNMSSLANVFLDKGMQKTVRIPRGITLGGRLLADGSVYNADLRASQGGGWLTLKGRCNTSSMVYNADIKAHAFPLQHFLPDMGLTPFSGNITLMGAGTDIFSSRTQLNANAHVTKLHYNGFDLSGTTATARVSNGVVYSNLHCINGLLRGDISLDALLSKNNLKATVACNLDKADLYGMKLVESPLSTSLCAHVDVASNMDDYYKVQGFVSDVVISDSTSLFFRTSELYIDALTRRDSTWAKMNSGDFMLDMSASGGYRELMSLADNMAQELNKQIARKYISQDSLKQVLPIGHFTLRSGKNNLVAGYATKMGYKYREINVDVTSSPDDGLNGYVQIDSLYAFDMQLDKIRLDIETDSTGFKYRGQIKNEKNNPQYSFNALFDGSLFETGSSINLSLYDEKNRLGIKMGVNALLEHNGIRIKFADPRPVLGYRNFTANEDNYFFLADNNRVSANMALRADDGTGLQIFSNDDNIDALQDLTLHLNQLDLASVVSVVPYMPNVKGIMNGDFHIIQTDKELSVSTSLDVNSLVYEGSKMGNISSEFVYMPLEDGGHYLDGILSHNGNEVGTIKGTYKAGTKEGILDADVDLERLPLDWVNGFIPDKIIGLQGYGDGKLTIDGPLSAMQIDGEVLLDSASLVSVPYGVEMKFENRMVRIKNSKLLLENFNMYANNDQPLVINGNVDFSNMDKMMANLRMSARNFLVIDAKENRRSEVFGKTYVNFLAMMTGPLSALQIRGKLDVLSSTDMTYILRDSPLTTDNKMDELVKFTDFRKTADEITVRPPIEGLYMDLAISVSEGARVFCALNATKTNYLDMTGGGDLRMVYSQDELRLTGRYTLNSGEMKYSLPVIPLKNFTIQEGSYVEFTGDVMNPTLNITATETTKANVSSEGTNYSTTFNCGVVITQTLNNMGLEFIIEAPEDMTINSELRAMTKEERGKIAVTMLTTGMYMSDNNLSSFSMNNALSSFLQGQINTISGNALRTLDLSLGIDNSTDATGALHTDYTFKFAKRFWNNRIRIVVGGKVSSNQTNAESLFDNIAFEYRLNEHSNTNLRLFYNRATYDYLEGYVGSYGVGVAWKRKLQSIGELFRWRKSGSEFLLPDVKEIIPDTVENKKTR